MRRDTPFFFEYVDQGWQHCVSEGWGRCRRWVEVLGQEAHRQIDFYDNGCVLKYDREHERDEYGHLIGLRFSWKAKWKRGFGHVREMSSAEFERAWDRTRTVVL